MRGNDPLLGVGYADPLPMGFALGEAFPINWGDGRALMLCFILNSLTIYSSFHLRYEPAGYRVSKSIDIFCPIPTYI